MKVWGKDLKGKASHQVGWRRHHAPIPRSEFPKKGHLLREEEDRIHWKKAQILKDGRAVVRWDYLAAPEAEGEECRIFTRLREGGHAKLTTAVARS